jgi:HSP20 family protein
LEEFFQPFNSEARGASFRLDVEETESAYQLTADLPGLEKSDINVDLHENMLTMFAERKEERSTRRASCGMSVYWRVSRTIQLPQSG